MQKITPFLWFDDQAEQAMNLYTSIFKNSSVVDIRRYPEGPLEEPMKGMEGKVLTGAFEIEGQRFMALDGGPVFKFTPAISFFVTCKTTEEVDDLWGKLSEGGSILMELQAYPFSEKFGWLEDRFGLSWQINLGTSAQKISPFLMFVGKQHGKAEEAVDFYTSLFKDSGIESIQRYGANEGEQEGTVQLAKFLLAGQEFMALDSKLDHPFTFNEAISFYVDCKSQEEVDYFWQNLSAVPSSEQCGWLKDKYGVSWQIVPSILPELLDDPDPEKSNRVIQAMLQMKKIDVNALQQAYEEKGG